MRAEQINGAPPPLTHTLITGASAGIGLELARLFAADGQPLVLVARRLERLTALAETLRRDYEIEARVVAADLTAPDAAAHLVSELATQNLGVRVLVNNAGMGAYGRFNEQSTNDLRRLLDLNITALTELTSLLLPPMVAAHESVGLLKPGIMNVASTAAFQPGPLMAVYFASKSYVLSFSEALHEELRGTGVTVSAFCPGPTRSEFFTTGPMIPGDARDEDGAVKAAAAAEFARRDARRMDTAVAARIGYAGYRAGRAVVVPGWGNRLMAQSYRFLPRGLLRRIVHRMMKKSWE